MLWFNIAELALSLIGAIGVPILTALHVKNAQGIVTVASTLGQDALNAAHAAGYGAGVSAQAVATNTLAAAPQPPPPMLAQVTLKGPGL